MKSRSQVAVLCGLLICAIAGCSSAETTAKDTPTGVSAPTSRPSRSPIPEPPAGTAPINRPPDRRAAATITPVSRPGASAASRLPVTEKSSADDAVYSDKVTIAIEKMTRSKASGQGPGVMSGAPLLSVQVVVRNSSSKPLDLSAVVVSLRYGSPERIAPGSYDAASVDFSGKLQPGAHATATYTFVVPADAGDKVRVVVDIDGSHQPAVFRGMRRS